MEHTLIIILSTMAIYLALFIHVAFSPKISKRLIAVAGIAAVVCGLLFYGFCFSSICDNLILAILKTCHAVCLLFVGDSSMEAIADAPMMQYVFVQAIFSALSFLGIFTTAGAAISAIGASFLCKLRLYLQRNRSIDILYPLTPKTLEFARELIGKHHLVIFVDEKPDTSCIDGARELGCMVRTDEDAISGNRHFVWSLGLGKHKRTLTLYALSDDRLANRQYASQLVDSMQKQNISPEQASLFIFANEDETPDIVLNQSTGRSYGRVTCLSHAQLAARLLMQKAPPWEAISFDENGRATEDFQALVVGSGKVGQAVIKQLVMNSQFSGSQFALTIFDPNYERFSGLFDYECRHLFQHYNIKIKPFDGRSKEMYAFLQENGAKLKYIVVCTGNDTANQEISRQLARYMETSDHALPIYICSRRGLQRVTTLHTELWNIFTLQVLDHDLAKLLNQSFCINGASPQENWDRSDYFSRASSRAAADFAPVFLQLAGPSSAYSHELMENLAITEHERWRAFMFCMGWRPMTEAEIQERCHIYLREKAKDPRVRYRIDRDAATRTHALMVPWEQLDGLSQTCSIITGRPVDYKSFDSSFVQHLIDLLQQQNY